MKDNTPLYRYPDSHAREHGELEQYRASNRANLQCKESIEAAIRVVANLQIFVTLLCENITLGYMLSMMIELLSIFGSERLSPREKMLLIGNWGMIIRTTVVNPNGISISAAIVLEVVILITLWELGWRVIRKHRKGA